MKNGDVVVTSCMEAGKGRLRVRFDTGVTCRLYKGEAGRMQIHKDSVLAQEQYQMLMTEILGKRAKKRALHLLEQMDRTEYNLRQKLADAEYPQICIDDAVAYVRKYHYLDDERYASNFVRFSQEKMSRGQIRQKMMERGIARDIADRVLEEEYKGNEEAQIAALLVKRHYDPQCKDQKEFQRTYQFLLRRGFKSSDILRAMKQENFMDSDF